jgi:hypothetical protein
MDARESVTFQLNGAQLTLDLADVRRTMAELVPEQPRTHVVEVDGTQFPVKQAFSAVTGVDRLDFTTNQARMVLKRLGLVVRRIEDK